LVQLHKDTEKIEAAGIQVVAISYDSVDILKKFSDSAEISFPLLSDEGSKTIHAYNLHFKKGLPHPSTLLIDQTGMIRGKLFREGYADRHATDELIALANELK